MPFAVVPRCMTMFDPKTLDTENASAWAINKRTYKTSMMSKLQIYKKAQTPKTVNEAKFAKKHSSLDRFWWDARVLQIRPFQGVGMVWGKCNELGRRHGLSTVVCFGSLESC